MRSAVRGVALTPLNDPRNGGGAALGSGGEVGHRGARSRRPAMNRPPAKLGE